MPSKMYLFVVPLGWCQCLCYGRKDYSTLTCQDCVTIQIKACFEKQLFGFIVIVISRCIKLVNHISCKILFALRLSFHGIIILTANIIA